MSSHLLEKLHKQNGSFLHGVCVLETAIKAGRRKDLGLLASGVRFSNKQTKKRVFGKRLFLAGICHVQASRDVKLPGLTLESHQHLHQANPGFLARGSSWV